ncbi:MAG TPA: PIG-L family deacetylase [Kofleriaceae bacterium]|nr:PIG-L family deacetylase [Kofleriaceae bacterium]
MMMRAILVMAMAWLTVGALGTLAGPAAAETDLHAGALAHALDRVATTGRVLYVAAHPDDENTRLLAYLANVRHLEVAYLAMTRGGGGQNLIGGEQGPLLDVIRTEELLAARRIDGARQFFTRMRDFGYSKRADETLTWWGHDEALADVVWVIRTFQPDIIITRFTESPPNHGHHTASAILAREAFAAAADPNRFPEQLAGGVTVWQADRLLQNIPGWNNAPVPKEAVALEIGAYDPRLGLEIGELAARSRSQHKSQGFGVPADRGPVTERFLPLAGKKPTSDLFEGLDLTWQRYGAAAAGYVRAIGDAQRALDRDHPERAVPALIAAGDELDKLARDPKARRGDDPRVRDARRALGDVLVAAAGVYARATSSQPVAAPGATVEVDLELVARALPVTVSRIELPGAAPLTAPLVIARGKKEHTKLSVSVPDKAPPTIAYWLAQPPVRGRYNVADPRQIGAPRQPPALEATALLQIAGHPARVTLPVVHAWTDPVRGELTRPFVIVPPATVTPVRDAVMAPGKAAPLVLRVRAGKNALAARVELELPAGWTARPAAHEVSLAKIGDEATLRFDVTPAPGAAAGEARPVVRADGAAWSLREDTIDYGHIPLQVVLRPAAVQLVPLSLRIPAGRVGYVRGSGDSIAADLAHVGFTVDELDEDALRTGDLARYSTIILGIRAFNTRDPVRAAHGRLMGYVEHGGTLIVQYNTLDLEGPIGPFPLELGRARITDETAAPTFLDPKDPLLASPNRITTADFDGWVQERGIYFAIKWDPRFHPVLRFSDPGEGPLDGSLVVARHGKGRYIYTGLALFRQLPAGVPGAYRLFANLIGAGK